MNVVKTPLLAHPENPFSTPWHRSKAQYALLVEHHPRLLRAYCDLHNAYRVLHATHDIAGHARLAIGRRCPLTHRSYHNRPKSFNFFSQGVGRTIFQLTQFRTGNVPAQNE
jgi:hypothetical protein